MHLNVALRHCFKPARRHDEGEARFALDVAFSVASSSVAIAGPSGSGKSTVLNAIAGLMRPQQASIEIDGTVIVDTARRIFVPLAQRRIGYVFQDGRLFPHLSVRQNLLYGRWFSRRGREGVAFDDVVDLLDIARLLDRWPGGLSGGEKQRVAIGRALLARPRVLLLDEPLAALDRARREQILPLIEKVRDEFRTPIVLVSHDSAEVARIGTSCVRIENGRVVPAAQASMPPSQAVPAPVSHLAHQVALKSLGGSRAQFGAPSQQSVLPV